MVIQFELQRHESLVNDHARTTEDSINVQGDVVITIL